MKHNVQITPIDAGRGGRLRRAAAKALITGLLALLALPAVAVAQQVGETPSDAQYSDSAAHLQGQVGPEAGTGPDPGTGSGLSSEVGPLPFTGFDVIAMAAVALAVTGLGLGLQRAVARDPEPLDF